MLGRRVSTTGLSTKSALQNNEYFTMPLPLVELCKCLQLPSVMVLAGVYVVASCRCVM